MPRPCSRRDRQFDDHVAWTHEPQILARQPLEHAGIVTQALDAPPQPLAAGRGLGDLRLQQPLAGARRFQVAGALQRGDRQQREHEKHGRAQHRAERIGPDGRVGWCHGDQRGKAAAPG
jgi:hypothetical protein